MKHLFIINPEAGKKTAVKHILPKIKSIAEKIGIHYKVHITKRAGDAESYARIQCEYERGYPLRIYGVGGDGTLCEIVNGIYGYNNVEFTIIPTGTGNDFVRLFSKSENFMDIEKQIHGQAMDLDVLTCNHRYLINLLNYGIDSAVVGRLKAVKNIPFLKGPLAYLAGGLFELITNRGYPIQMTLDDKINIRGEATLIAAGNGSYCGGGFNSLPYASPTDGLIDVIIVSKINRLMACKILPKYKNGTHLENTTFAKYIRYHQCKTLTLTLPPNHPSCIDGELFNDPTIVLSIAPNTLPFSVPVGSQLINKVKIHAKSQTE